MPEFKGYETAKHGMPSIKEGAGYVQVPDVNMSARGDMPKEANGVPSTQGYRGPAEAGFDNKSTSNISKLGPSN